ncbi:unnamed protein product [Rotaria sordida]|nr:unnamed protein product [Rotaria sordida]
MTFNFDKYDNTVVNTLNTPYDYASIMHYEKTAFSINYLPAIEPTQTNKKIGQRYKLSPIDIQEIRQFYNCSANGVLLPTTIIPTTTIAPSLNPSYYSSEFTINHPMFARNGSFGTNYYYETLRLTIPASGSYTFQCTSYIDSFASLYYTNFNPSSPATNLFLSSDDANADNWEFKFTINFPSDYTMDFVVTTYSPSVTGPFQIVATGPNKATLVRTSSIGNPSITSTTTTTTRSTTTTTTTTTTRSITTTTTRSTTTTTTRSITTTTTRSTTTTTTTTRPITTTTTTTRPITTTTRSITTTRPITTTTTTTRPITTTTRPITTTTRPITTTTTTTRPITTTTRSITTTTRSITTTTRSITTTTRSTTTIPTTTTTVAAGK